MSHKTFTDKLASDISPESMRLFGSEQNLKKHIGGTFTAVKKVSRAPSIISPYSRYYFQAKDKYTEELDQLRTSVEQLLSQVTDPAKRAELEADWVIIRGEFIDENAVAGDNGSGNGLNSDNDRNSGNGSNSGNGRSSENGLNP